MVPLVQTTVHQDAPALTASPQAGDEVRFYEHSRLNPTPHPQGFDAWGYPTGSAAPVYHDATVLDVGTMTDPADAPASRLSKFTWVAFDPDDYTQGATGDRLFDPDAGTVEPYVGESGFFDPTARRWKVLNAAADTLSGEMPCYPGATFHIGGSAAGGEQFTGELDEVRLSVLPVAMPYTGLLTAAADWSAGPNLNVDTWAWDQDLGGGILGPGPDRRRPAGPGGRTGHAQALRRRLLRHRGRPLRLQHLRRRHPRRSRAAVCRPDQHRHGRARADARTAQAPDPAELHHLHSPGRRHRWTRPPSSRWPTSTTCPPTAT